MEEGWTCEWVWCLNVAWIEVERREVAFAGGDFERRVGGPRFKKPIGSGAESIEIIPSRHDFSILNQNSHCPT